MKEIFQTKLKAFPKDLDFSYQPFLPILGTGLVTSHNDLWQRQRLLMAPTLRVEILATVISLTTRALQRLTQLLEAARASGQTVNIEEEFRLMTLQIIGGAVLSLDPDQCNEVSIASQNCTAGMSACHVSDPVLPVLARSGLS